MNILTSLSTALLLATTFLSYGQKVGSPQSTPAEPKIIAVINRANWCASCKANGERFGNNILPYSTQGLAIIENDLMNETTIEKSKSDLKKSSLYKQIYKTNRKGAGKMMQTCGIVHSKNKSMISGIVTFIDAKTFLVLKEVSIAITDSEMKTIIETLLKS